MTGSTVNGKGKGARSGAQALVLLAAPLNVLILRALAEKPMGQGELRQETGSPAQSTLRAQLKKLERIGAVATNRQGGFPGGVTLELTAAGRELVAVAEALDRWLHNAPDGPLPLGSTPAKAAIMALTEGWSTAMLRALAARPMTLTELDNLLPLNYPSLERRLAAMRGAGQVEARPGNGRGTPYGVTEWARQGVGPLSVASRWELRHQGAAAAPVGRVDVEASFLLSMPLLRLDDAVTGSGRLAVEIANGKGPALAGVQVEAREARIVRCTTRLEGYPDAWACGPPTAWLAAAIDADTDQLEQGGDCLLANTLVRAMHEALFGTEALVAATS